MKFFKSKIKKYCLFSTSFDYLIWEESDTEAIIKTQIVDCSQRVIKNSQEILELIYKNNKLHRVNEYYDGEGDNIDLSKHDQELLLPTVVEVNHLKYLLGSPTSTNKLFGVKSEDFKIPISQENYTVNYYGKLDKKLINWLPFDQIELFAPEFLQGILFIDYSNPQQPKYLNEEVIQKANYPDTGQGFTIKYFDEKHFSLTEVENYENPTVGYFGAPLWVQYPEIPRCPKTNNVMKFMLEIDVDYESDSALEVLCAYNYEPAVYIFMEPISKIVGIVLQRS